MFQNVNDINDYKLNLSVIFDQKIQHMFEIKFSQYTNVYSTSGSLEDRIFSQLCSSAGMYVKLCMHDTHIYVKLVGK